MKDILATILLVLAAAPAVGATDFGRTDKAAVIANSAELIERRYVDPESGKRIASALRENAGRWDGVEDPAKFAAEVTAWLRSVSGDGHLGLSFSEKPIPPEGGEQSFSAGEMERWYGAHLNHGIERIERLPGNIMLLDLRVFAPTDVAGDVFAAAMTVVAQGDALIIDLRQNGGGSDTANLLAGYLLDGSKPLSGFYDRPSDRLTANQSPTWVPGRRFGGSKPLYILTSRSTFSAAEAVAYDLQALKRAIIVGERTGGGAHPFAYRRVHTHFALDLPESRSVNPITGTNWQDVGVQPDVAVAADQALEKALELARAQLAKDR